MGGSLRLLTLNLRNDIACPHGASELIEETRADVAVFQELGPNQAEVLARSLPHGELEPATNYSGMGIVLRRQAKLQRLELPHRDARMALLEPEHWPGLGFSLEVINLHILAPHAHPLAGFKRRGQVHGLLRHLDSTPRPRVLLGDFNATPMWPAYWRLASRLTDAAKVAAGRTQGRPQRTWGPWAGSPRLLRIDHAMVSHVEVESTQVLEIPGSDHSALLVEIGLETNRSED